jgi:hypothetical protein
MRATHRWTGGIRVLVTNSGEWSEKYIACPDSDGNIIASMHEWGVMGSFPDGDGSAYPVLPDLTDPATLGCLLAIVREAWGQPRLTVEMRQPSDRGARACVVVPYGSEAWETIQWWVASETTELIEAEALVAALEAAP